MTVDLKPCPWCDGPAEITHEADGRGSYVMITCTKECWADPHVHANTEEEALARWNRREGDYKQCPFCGSDPVLREYQFANMPKPRWVVSCGIEGGTLRNCVWASTDGRDDQEPLSLWRMRRTRFDIIHAKYMPEEDKH